MEERTDQPMFDLFLDQQVFVDAVHGNEKIDQFSAYTEVTSFEQRGDSLHLEGNILMAAYLERFGQAGEEERVEHVEYRMPFNIAVPVIGQPAGMLNVKVHVPEMTLDILGPGWLHFQALLVVEGLTAEMGVTASCGAQEIELPPQVEEWDPLAQPKAGQGGDAEPPVSDSLSEENWKIQLQGADRAFHGKQESTAQVDSEPVESAQIEAVPELFDMRADPPFPVESPVKESQSRSKELAEEQAETRFVDSLPQTSYSAAAEEEVTMTAAEWFWKTLNIPAGETRYILKYRILQAGETLEEIAQTYRVQLTELLAVNRLKMETAVPGAILYIPRL